MLQSVVTPMGNFSQKSTGVFNSEPKKDIKNEEKKATIAPLSPPPASGSSGDKKGGIITGGALGAKEKDPPKVGA